MWFNWVNRVVCSGVFFKKVLFSFKMFYKYCFFIFSNNDDNSYFLWMFVIILLEKDFNEWINGYVYVNLIVI